MIRDGPRILVEFWNLRRRPRLVQYSAMTGIRLGYDKYFDDEIILSQFERPFLLLHLKTEYKRYDFKIIIDNARTYSAKEFNFYDFLEGIRTRRPLDSIEFIDVEGKSQQMSFYFSNGEHKEKLKSSLILSKELEIDEDDKIKLDELLQVLFSHSAFRNF